MEYQKAEWNLLARDWTRCISKFSVGMRRIMLFTHIHTHIRLHPVWIDPIWNSTSGSMYKPRFGEQLLREMSVMTAPMWYSPLGHVQPFYETHRVHALRLVLHRKIEFSYPHSLFWQKRKENKIPKTNVIFGIFHKVQIWFIFHKSVYLRCGDHL